ncbi:MAG TPA: fumarylacetoacetate hydrolase family protein [Terriglobales bacterium]|nr:fumarylacetoacetate hydrolase family protein [Terriglobales bacterium]
MKYCCFEVDQQVQYGLVEPVAGQETITRLLLTPPHEAEEDLEDLPSRRCDPMRLSSARLLAPGRPSKIVCVGRNYREHAAELGNEVPPEPLIFLKPPSALLAPGKKIVRPALSQRVDHEGELGVLIAKTCHSLPAGEDVRPFILGYTCVNDVTARDLQKKDGQWTRGKGFDTFCPVGPVVNSECDPWAGVGVQTRVNGELRQDGNTRDFIFPLDVIIRYIARVMTLLPGDLIATGTPSGVGPIAAGDVVEVSVEGVGSLSNPVVDEEAMDEE